MGVVITNVTLSSKSVNVGSQVKISVSVKETITEPKLYRLPFILGSNKGGIK